MDKNNSASRERAELIEAARKAKAKMAQAKADAKAEQAKRELQAAQADQPEQDAGAAKPDTPATVTPQTRKTPNHTSRNGPAAERKKRRFGLNSFLFLLIVAIPTLGAGLYYYFVAQDQYMSTSRFAVRGVEGAAIDGFNLSMLPGSSTQATDAYIVNEYIRSVQLVNDLKERRNIDVRAFYSKPDIDPLYRIDPDMPPEEFMSYWNWMSESDYNSTTQITTFQVRAFSADDAKDLADAVIEAAGELINRLSSDARRQIVRTARSEVARTEERLRNSRRQLTNFRNREQSVDPAQRANQKETLAGGLEKELIELRLRRTALRSTIDAESPTIRVLDRRIKALSDELERQRRIVGTGASEAPKTSEKGENLSLLFEDYSELLLEADFSEKAYTAALSSLEASQADARKQERYFAIVVEPTKPEVSLYPRRISIVLTIFGVSILVWFLAYLITQSIRDHAV